MTNFFSCVTDAAVARYLHQRGLVTTAFPGTAAYNPIREEAARVLIAIGFGATDASPESPRKFAERASFWYDRAILRSENGVSS